MQLVYAGEPMPSSLTKSLFLAGPSPRGAKQYNWRPEAIEILEQLAYDGVVFIPLPRDGNFPREYAHQVDWELRAMDHSDVIAFWIPRDLEYLPGFTTNVEFGMKVQQHQIVLGFPADAPKMRYLAHVATREGVAVEHTLSSTLKRAVTMIGEGADRIGGETQVPIALWRAPQFQNWLTMQKHAGNRLDGCQVLMLFFVGPSRSHLFYWCAHVNLHVAAEQRNKVNEIVISRPDIRQTIGFCRAPDVLDSEVVLVREFRSNSATVDGFIREIPGGSSQNPTNPREDAAREFFEETGIPLEASRLIEIGVRQLSGITTAHRSHVFAVELTPSELHKARLSQHNGVRHGIAADTEWTYVEVRTVRELLCEPITDWSNLGMILTALLQR